jgi:putative flippase GtrA
MRTHEPDRRVLVRRHGAVATMIQFARFGTVGVSNTLVSFVSYAVALQLGVRYLLAGAGAFALGAMNGFVLNRTWTFDHRGPKLRAGWRYVVVQLAGLAATVAFLRLAVSGIGLPRLPAQVAAAVPVTLLCFALSRVWVFGASPTDDVPGPHTPPVADRARADRLRRLRSPRGGAAGERVAVR